MPTKRKQTEAGGTKKKAKTDDKTTTTTATTSTSTSSDSNAGADDGYEADEEGEGDIFRNVFRDFVAYLRNQCGIQEIMTQIEDMMW